MSKEEKEYRLIPYTEDDEIKQIQFSDLLFTIWKQRKIITIITVCFAVYGVLSSLATSEEFTSSSSVLPNVEEGSQLSGAMQQFTGLLGNTGIELGSEGSQIDATLYPEIIFSTPAMYEFIYSEIYSPELDTTLTVKEYMLEHRETSTLVKITGGFLKYTIHLPITIVKGVYGSFRYLLSLILGENVPEESEQMVSANNLNGSDLPGGTNVSHSRLTVEEFNFIREMQDKISTQQDNNTGLFIVEVSTPEPEISAQLTQAVVDYLTEYITEYRTEKLERNLKFINERYEESEEEFEKIQTTLSEFRDRNINLSTARMLTDQQRLESQYQLKFDLLNSIAQKRDEARIKLEEETPIFNILEPVSIPTTRSKPARALITITFTLLGIFVGLFWAFLRQYMVRNSK